jgi:hypothetical protein
LNYEAPALSLKPSVHWQPSSKAAMRQDRFRDQGCRPDFMKTKKIHPEGALK